MRSPSALTLFVFTSVYTYIVSLTFSGAIFKYMSLENTCTCMQIKFTMTLFICRLVTLNLSVGFNIADNTLYRLI